MDFIRWMLFITNCLQVSVYIYMDKYAYISNYECIFIQDKRHLVSELVG